MEWRFWAMLHAVVEGVGGGREPVLRAFDEISLNLAAGGTMGPSAA